MIKLGSDYSKHNGYKPMKSSDQFVILRAGYGKNNIDKEFRSNVEQCKQLGIPYGVYWFSYALNAEMARKEAEYCIDIINSLDYKPEYPVYYDNEYDSNNYFKKCNKRNYTKAEFNEMTSAFCSRLEELGYYAGIYVNKDYLKNYLSVENQNKYTLWIANYTGVGSESTFKGMHKNCHLIQYTNNPWDKNVCRIDFPSVMRKAHLNGW